jgi:hypothetical protein
MFSAKLSEDGVVSAIQTLTDEDYKLECVLKDNRYYVRCTDNTIFSVIAQVNGTGPALYSQVVYVDGVAVVTFVNSFGAAKKTEFNLTVTLSRNTSTSGIASISEVFGSILRV